MHEIDRRIDRRSVVLGLRLMAFHGYTSLVYVGRQLVLDIRVGWGNWSQGAHSVEIGHDY